MSRFGHRSIYLIGVLWINLCLNLPVSGTVQLQIGHSAPAFELTDTQGTVHRLSDYKGKIVVVHFQSCRCPWDVAYQPILNDIARRFTASQASDSGLTEIVFLAINSNRTESLDQIKAYQESGKIAYPILKDPGNQVADDYGAVTTPHIFVINSDPTQTLAYFGGIEKAPLSPQACGASKDQYLLPVLTALSQGTPPEVTQTQSVGCSIKRK